MIPKNACLVARVFVPDVGPCVARVDGESLVDVTASFPTMRDLCEEKNPAAAVRAAKGNTLGSSRRYPGQRRPRHPQQNQALASDAD